jgi:hypothetical protein
MGFFLTLFAMYVITMLLARGGGLVFNNPSLPPRIARGLALVIMGAGFAVFVGVGSRTESDAEGIALAGVFLSFLALSAPCWFAYFLLRRRAKPAENEGPGFNKTR